jgi:hypothetical protein
MALGRTLATEAPDIRLSLFHCLPGIEQDIPLVPIVPKDIVTTVIDCIVVVVVIVVIALNPFLSTVNSINNCFSNKKNRIYLLFIKDTYCFMSISVAHGTHRKEQVPPLVLTYKKTN